MLNIALPVSNSDVKILPDLVKAMVKFGGLEGHKITVFPTPFVSDEAADLTQPLASLVQAGNFVQAPLNIEPEQGWPIGPNQHFVAVMNYMQQMNSQLPFLWLEPDCCPVKPWANEYETEYNRAGKPYMGHLRDTSEVIKGEQGKHMVAGGAIFPADVWKRFTWWIHAAQRYDMPFDIFLRHEFLGPGLSHPRCHDTKLVQHLPRSQRFFKVGQDICGETVEGKDGGGLVVSSNTVLVHGCKDGSLSKVVCGHQEMTASQKEDADATRKILDDRDRAQYIAASTPRPAPQPVSGGTTIPHPWKQTVELPEVSPEDQKNEGYLAIWNVIKDWGILVPGNSFASAPAKPGHVALIMNGLMALEPAQTLPQQPVGQPTKTRSTQEYLVELLKESPKNEMEVTAASQYLKVSEDYVREMATEDGRKCLFKLDGPGEMFVRLSPRGVKMAANL